MGLAPALCIHFLILQCRRHFLRVDRHFNAGSECHVGSVQNYATEPIIFIRMHTFLLWCRQIIAIGSVVSILVWIHLNWLPAHAQMGSHAELVEPL